jgi:nitroreductase
MTPLLPNRSPVFLDQPGCFFSGKWRFVSQGFEIIKDEISCLIRFSQDLRNWMRSVIKRHPKQAEQRGFVRVVSAWDTREERICRGAPHVIVVHGDKDYSFDAEDGALALSYLELFAPTLGLGSCWDGYFYLAVNAYAPLFEALDLPSNHRTFGAVMVGYAKLKYQRLPLRNEPRVDWKL